MQQIPIYFKSDFKLFIKTEAGFAVPFKFEFYTNMPSRPYIVKFDGHKYHNCELLEDGRLCIAFDDHGFGLGKLMIRQSYYLNDADYASEICDRVIAPQPVVNIDDNLLRSEIVLALSGDDTIEFTSQLPPYYQAGLTPEEHQALIDATVHAEEAAASANEQAGIATEAAKAADEARQALTTAYNEKVAALDADYAQKKSALEADYAGVKNALSSDYDSVKAQLDADYAATKEALATDYTTALAGLNDRMTAIESQFSADREAWNKSVADFITSSQATSDGKLTAWQSQVDAAIADITRLQQKDEEQDQKLSELEDVVQPLYTRVFERNSSPAYYPITKEANIHVGTTVKNMGSVPLVLSSDSELTNRHDLNVNESWVTTSIINRIQTREVSGNAALIAIGKIDGLVNRVEDVETNIADLHEDVFDEETRQETIGVVYNVQDGYVDRDGIFHSSASYKYTDKISVIGGDIVKFTRVDNDSLIHVRFITAYKNNVASPNDGAENTKTYVVPNGVDSIIISIDATALISYGCNITIIRDITINSIKGSRKIEYLFNKGVRWIVNAPSLNANQVLTIVDNVHNKKGAEYIAYAKFANFSTLVFGKGQNEPYSSYVAITHQQITVYEGGVAQAQQNHGLTIQDFMFVRISVGQASNGRATIYLATNGGNVTIPASANTNFANCQGSVRLYAGMSMTDVKAEYFVSDLAKDVIVFGDSYTSLADNRRWTDQLLNRGINSFAISGFAGGKSMDEIVSFNAIKDARMPHYVIWALGMNDSDNDAINENWLSCVQQVIKWCEENDRVIILATIPNVPAINNTFKNNWVRNSGKRYIDFAKAVGADDVGSSWYEGMLHADKVHPTESGAIALADRVLLDVPEIIL